MLKIVRLQALVCLLCFQLATAQGFRALRRDDNSISSPTASLPSPEPSSQHSVTKEPDDKHRQTESPREPTITKAPETTTSVEPTIQITTTLIALEAPLDSSTLFNTTIPAGHLPIQPIITPGWSVAGVILMLTGLVYTLVGIKNRWINCFFSTAFITALGISVLIVYIMNVPVSLGIQGAYVVAVTLSGCALGGASLIFKELTEGLGCALGGFCLSMWFLCLAPGGLIHDTVGKAVFISCMSVFGFCFYFSRYTRDWAMIFLMSFGGATVIVLGIDCFSRAGLKEFWAYVWNLNDNLFPLGADTYPITRGIRVEIAAIVIICLIGIVSQVKLWKVVREKREKKAAGLAESRRYLEEEEAIVGRNIEAQAARERVEWEKVYAGRVLVNSKSTASQYSDGTDGASNSKGSPAGYSGSAYTSSKADGIEMTDFPDSSGLVYSEKAEGVKVMVRVAADEIIESPNDNEDEIKEKNVTLPDSDAVSYDGERSASDRNVAKGKQLSQASSEANGNPQQKHVTVAPEVVPLPFKIPVEDDLKSIGDRSSVATFADDEAIAPASLPRDSLVKRVSQSSVTLLRSLSQQKNKVSSERQLETGESSEELVEPAVIPHHDDDQSSLAATVDYDSMSDDDAHSSVIGNEQRKSIEINAELGDAEETGEPKKAQTEIVAENNASKTDDEASQNDAEQDIAPELDAELQQKDVERSGMEKNQEKDKESLEAKTEDAADVDEETSVPREQESTATASNGAEALKPLEPTEKATSLSSATSNVVSLTKDRLPESLSRVALSYRTNEWTKHLSHADTPEPEAIYIEPYASEQDAQEVPRYVDVEDLQRTVAGDIISPPAAKISNSKTAQVSFAQPNPRNGKKKHHLSNVVISTAAPSSVVSPNGSPRSPTMDASLQPASPTLRRTSTGFSPIVEEQDGIQAAGVPISEEAMQQDRIQSNSTPFRPIVPRVVSFSNPHTLLGQRESVLRSRSQGNLVYNVSEFPIDTQGSVGDAESLYNYPVYNRVLSPDPDDLPLSRRREILRQSSMANLPPSNFRLNRTSSGVEVSGNTHFNSHQPKRESMVSVVARETKLANFRQSIAHDLQSMTPGVPGNMGRETPFASTSTLIDDIEVQRTILMEKKEAEMQRREMQRRQKEWNDRMFDSRMRSGDLLDAHREVIRKMQSSARDA
ncbi:uncharacterized protein Triagg1_6735 [Trichoderma aggressivum f. europaeum]|uniref:TM7S3/TM198-like domain-containing protein n=1 Tax=Trichoderma aggressivum f. europaeum TaxID=173218 RepID=A0AAE1J747_9HYPO|nr:hypothetical protein Triagg1_6735 [Trichoderma aggressivum f. europaeum]